MAFKSRMIRRAQLMADAVAVICPYCGEPQPNRTDGSEQWTFEDFAKILGQPSVQCVACDRVMHVECDTKVQFAVRDVVVR